jgi:hypothetical protein
MVQRGIVGAGETVEEEVQLDQRFGALKRVVATLDQEGNWIVSEQGIVHNGTMSRSISRKSGK